MQSAQELAQHWGRRSLTFPGAELGEVGMPAEAAEPLGAGAVPRSTAPRLSFGARYTAGSKRRSWLPSVADAFDNDGEGLEDLCIIGEDGGGQPVAVHLDTGVVVLVDHEGDFTTEAMNSDVAGLARCLVSYDQFVRTVENELGSHGYVDGLYKAAHVDELERQLKAIDASVLADGSFWARDLAKLRAEVS